MEGITAMKCFKKGRSITLKQLVFRQENQAWFMKIIKVFKGMKVPAKAFNIPCHTKETC